MKKNIAIISVILLPIIIWLIMLLKCEILTLKHGHEFEYIYKDNTMIGDIDYLKVLNYSENSARIYYISSNKSAGNILVFKKQNGEWIYSNWEKTVWSATGSASDIVWPYWWHFIYGGI